MTIKIRGHLELFEISSIRQIGYDEPIINLTNGHRVHWKDYEWALADLDTLIAIDKDPVRNLVWRTLADKSDAIRRVIK